MCGLNGIYAYRDSAPAVVPQELRATRDHMAARGPDGLGEWISADGRIGLGHRRLSIIDLSDAAAQPMSSADGTLVVVFNGEIYNYRELRRDLESAGRDFRSHSDTEVLLHLYAERGPAMVHALRGMFAFAIWDAARRRLFLARDPYGIDSGALVGLMRDAGAGDIQTLTLAFAEFRGRSDDEAPLAAEVARHYGTCHTTRTVTADEFQDDLPRIFAAMDQPSIDGINTWFVSKAARELGLKVAVSGLGGDELFGGYPSFADIPRWVRWLAPAARIPTLGKTLRRLSAPVLDTSWLRSRLSPKLPSLLEYGGSDAGAYLLRRGLYLPWELESRLDRETLHEGLRQLNPLARVSAQLDPPLRTPFARVATLESSLYMCNQLLRDTDWASMAHSLEIRVPLVDARLLEQVAPLTLVAPPGTTKGWLAEAPTSPLPPRIAQRRKTGFAIPVGPWTTAGQTAVPPSPYAYSRAWANRVAVAARDGAGAATGAMPGYAYCPDLPTGVDPVATPWSNYALVQPLNGCRRPRTGRSKEGPHRRTVLDAVWR